VGKSLLLALNSVLLNVLLGPAASALLGTLLEMHTVPNTMESATLGGASNLSLMTVGDPGYFNLRESPRTSPVRWDDSSSFRELLPDSSLPFLVLKRI
jgi:hypothetical protein